MNGSRVDLKQLSSIASVGTNGFEVSAANDQDGMMANFGLIGNMTDFKASFWTDQMSQILNASDYLPEDD